jgi:MoxR-like ATPase
MSVRSGWWIYDGTGQPSVSAPDGRWPDPPPWRDFNGGPDLAPPLDDHDETARRLGRASAMRPTRDQLDIINAALVLRRPLLVTGRPGVGKSSLAYRIAHDLGLGRVLHWPITSRSTLRSGLYDYDAIGRAQAAAEFAPGTGEDLSRGLPIGDFIHLGPLGTALLPYALPRVLLIDELDKSDIDLPNDLLNVFEDGTYTVPELIRLRSRQPDVEVHTADPGGRAGIRDGVVRCHAFPVVVITSNGERDFPAPFLRRCLRLDLPELTEPRLAELVAAHFGTPDDHVRQLIGAFIEERKVRGTIAADQLLNAVFLASSGVDSVATEGDWRKLLDAVWRQLAPGGS